MIDETDRLQQAKVAELLKSNPEFAKDYYARGTHDGHTSASESARRNRHLVAVAHVATLLEGSSGTPAATAPAAAPPSWPDEQRRRIAADLEAARRAPAYLNRGKGDPQHAAAVAEVTHLYWKLNNT